MGQRGHFTHVWVSWYEIQIFRMLTVVNGTLGIWGVTLMVLFKACNEVVMSLDLIGSELDKLRLS